MRSDIAIVIPSWNGKQLLAECLNSIDSQTLGRVNTLVVDDASTDGTSEMVRERFPWAGVLRLEQNSGFCAAVNAGIAHTASKYVFLLNNDITLHPDCIERLVVAAEQSGAGLIAPLILWRDQPDIVYSAGDLQRANGRPESIGFMSPCAGFIYPETVFGASAAAGLYRRQVFDEVGLLDCRFGTYFSDSDLSFRARLAGFDAMFVREAMAWHVGSASLGGNTLKRTRECFINHALLLIKDMPGPLFLRYLPLIVRERLHQVRRLFSAARAERGAFHAAIEVAAAALQIPRLIPHALRQRWRIQRNRKVSAVRIEALLSP